MRQVAILGIGQTVIGEHWDQSLREIGGHAALAAMQDGGVEQVEALYVGNMLSPLVSGQNQLGAFFGDWIGPWHKEAVKLEAACGSGAAAFRAALMAVASGDVDSALALGVEKMTDKAGHDVTAALATAADADYEVEQGVSFVGLNALIMVRYMHEYGWKHGDFAPFSINAHANAVHNPYARLRDKISLEKFERASMIATPINLLDASPIGDGAAAAILVPAEKVKSLPGRPRSGRRGVGGCDRYDRRPFTQRAPRPESRTGLCPAMLRTRRRNARRHRPVRVARRVLYHVRLVPGGLRLCGARAGCATGPGRQDLDQRKHPDMHQRRAQGPGHPVGATGMYQIVELVQQLRGECGRTQVDGARVGMAQNIGGSGASILTHILSVN